jgi:hypothetical protein
MTARPPKITNYVTVIIWLCISKANFLLIGWLINLLSCFTSAQPVKIGGARRRKAMFRNLKVLLIAVVVLVIAGGAYGFAASNTVQATSAGYSAQVVGGYTITGIKYNLNTDDRTQVDTITFDVAPTDLEKGVAVALVDIQTSTVSGKDTWTSCDPATAVDLVSHVTCTFSNLGLKDIESTNIVASSTASTIPINPGS